MRPARFKADRPGSPVWWFQYICGYYLGICWTGAPLHWADDDCRMFWGAERDILEFIRHPDKWEDAGLTGPPSQCIYTNETSGPDGKVTMTPPPAYATGGNSATVTCLCGRHQ